MSRPRGNRAQREAFAAVKAEAEARGWSARLDFSNRGGEQIAMLTGPRGQECRVPIHGTPKSLDDHIKRTRARAARIMERNR